MLADIGLGLSVVAFTGDEGAAFAMAARDMSEEVLTETAVTLGKAIGGAMLEVFDGPMEERCYREARAKVLTNISIRFLVSNGLDRCYCISMPSNRRAREQILCGLGLPACCVSPTCRC